MVTLLGDLLQRIRLPESQFIGLHTGIKVVALPNSQETYENQIRP